MRNKTKTYLGFIGSFMIGAILADPAAEQAVLPAEEHLAQGAGAQDSSVTTVAVAQEPQPGTSTAEPAAQVKAPSPEGGSTSVFQKASGMASSMTSSMTSGALATGRKGLAKAGSMMVEAGKGLTTSTMMSRAMTKTVPAVVLATGSASKGTGVKRSQSAR